MAWTAGSECFNHSVSARFGTCDLRIMQCAAKHLSSRSDYLPADISHRNMEIMLGGMLGAWTYKQIAEQYGMAPATAQQIARKTHYRIAKAIGFERSREDLDAEENAYWYAVRETYNKKHGS